MQPDEQLAWSIYCEETQNDMHVADFWEQLAPRVKFIYLQKAWSKMHEPTT